MVDAGVTTERGAEAVVTDGAGRVVVGLETLTSFEDLGRIVSCVGADRVAFSLDLCDAQPLTRPGAPFAGLSPLALGRRGCQRRRRPPWCCWTWDGLVGPWASTCQWFGRFEPSSPRSSSWWAGASATGPTSSSSMTRAVTARSWGRLSTMGLALLDLPNAQ